ncbi:MAG TPA: ATP-binding protein [Methylomirabilota bacterium]|nr:ATP-binding protein [Methylomirabilota bacterium]
MDRPDLVPAASGHAVQFYPSDAVLIATLTDYVATGLRAGQSCLVVATQAHRDAVDQRLRESGLDPDGARASGRYATVDADSALAQVLDDGRVDPRRFAEAVDGLFARLRPARPIRVFGEMVGLLLARGRSRSAIELEDLWNQRRTTRPFELLCAYPLAALADRGLEHTIVEICARHSHVTTAGPLPAGADDPGLADMTALRARASLLEAEVAQRESIEAALREVKGELETQVQDLRRLHDLTMRLAGNRDVDSVLREVLDAAMAMPGAPHGLLSLWDEERADLAVAVHAGFSPEILDVIRHERGGHGVWAAAFVRRQPVVVPDVATDPAFAAAREAAVRAGFRSCHSTPLLTRGGEIIGVLSLFFANPRRPPERELRLMDLYARIAADAIENARLHRALQRELEDRRASLAREHTARAEAESANRLKDEFLATVSHELRTPLNAILGWAHILRAGKPDEATVARGIEVIERNAHAQAQLVEDILDASRVITGTLRLTPVPVDPAPAVTAAAEAFRAAAQAKGVELVVTVDPDAGRVAGDPGRLQQMVSHLISNAIKFTAAGGRVEARLRRVRDGIEVQVSDTGEGIAPDVLPFVFDRFRQADSTITRRHGGLGLGLALVRHLAELHGGTVHAESPGEGYGATFTIHLPALDGAAEASEPEAPARPLHGVQVLVVEDDPDSLDMLSFMLGEAGASVRTASSAAEALILLRWLQPDVLLSDLAMPDEDGYALMRSVRKGEQAGGPRLPAVALTAYVRVQDRARAVEAGFDMFVEKPVNPDELLAVVSGLVETRRGQATRRTSA